MKEKLKIKFTDFWAGFNTEKNFFTDLLQQYFNLEISDNPDILIYSVYDFNHIKYSCRKIFYTGENVRPNFRECDFSISFDYDDYGGKNLRIPLYNLYWWAPHLINLSIPKDPVEIAASKTKFCCMVVSNERGKERNHFFELLNQYKKVDSGGKFLNNVGGPVEDKMAFIRDYKFVISFENSVYPGYTTEKIVEPMFENSIPVYWGNPVIEKEFNTKSFINVHDYSSFEKAIEEIVRIDKNDQLYMDYLGRPWFKDNQFPPELEYHYFAEQLAKVVATLLDKKPVSKSTLYKPITTFNKNRKKILSRIYKKPHFYF